MYYVDPSGGILPSGDSVYQKLSNNAMLNNTNHSQIPSNTIAQPVVTQPIASSNLHHPAPLQPSVQINIQPLIKPLQQSKAQHIQPVPPIVYSFGQTDYANKLFPKVTNSGKQHNRRISWGKDENLDVEDDFADILG